MANYERKGGSRPTDELYLWSRKLSQLLRHGILDTDLEMDTAGYVLVSQLLRLPKFKGCSLEKIKIIE